MKNTTLPIHAVTGLQALGWRKPRAGETGEQPIWPIMGASPDHDDSGDSDDDGDGDADDDAGKDGDADKGTGGDKDDADDTDWKAKFEAQQRINRNLERRSRKDKAALDQLRGGKQQAKSADKDDDQQVDPEKIRAAAHAEAQAEALKGRVVDKIEAKAAKFADPEDAAAILLRGKDVDDFIDDGKIDVEAIKDALDELAEKKPHLLAQGKRFQGSADGGARQSKTARPKDLGEALARHYRAK